MRDRTRDELPRTTSAPARRQEDVRRDGPPTLGRREWLALGVTTAGALAARGLLGQAAGATSASNPTRTASDLVIRNARALDAEAPISALATFETAPEHFFVRSHFGPPTQLPLAWTLAIDGEVQRPATLTLDEIRKMGAQTRPVTLECAGNGRGVFRLPKTSGVQWEYGAVSTATWTGVPLGALLERAGLTEGARHLWMEAADHAPGGSVPKFLRSIPRDVALGDVFVAYAMNDRPIPLLHGGPLRLIVPGWFGMASTKWLTHIHAMRAESDNYFMSRGYRYADGSAVTTMRPKSVIASPLAGQRVRAGSLTVRGQAWSGGAAIRAVDVSGDGGRTWHAARLVGTARPGAWRTWEADVSLRPGPALLMARATDATGAAQPIQAAPNPGGYANNSIHGVPIHVA
jgi:sulfite oxidase